MVGTEQPGANRVTSLFITDTSSDMEDATSSRQVVQSGKRMVCSSGSQTDGASRTGSWDGDCLRENGNSDQTAVLYSGCQSETQDKANGTCMVSLNIPNHKAKLQQNGSSMSPSSGLEVDHEMLAVKVVDMLLKKTNIEVKQEKVLPTEVSPKKRKRADTPEDNGQRSTKAVPTPKDKAITRLPSRDRSVSSPVLKRGKRIPSRSHDSESSESESDEDAFRRTRRRRLAIAASGSDSGSQKGIEKSKKRKIDDLKFKKCASEGASEAKSNKSIQTTSSQDSPAKSDSKDIRRYRDRDTASTAKGSSNHDLKNEPKKPTAAASASTIKTLSRRERQLTQPTDFWFQRYYNHLLAKVTMPKILGSTGNCFSRTMISHYLGGSARLTAATVSPITRDQQIYPVKFLMAFSKEFCPIQAKKPGEIIVIATVGDFTKRVPSHIPSFPVFLQRAVGEYEYMGTYEFDEKIKFFSEKETRELAEAPLVEFWVERFFGNRRHNNSLLENVSQLKLSKAGVNALAAQLVPEHLKKKDEVRRLKISQVREYLIKGTVRFTWSFLKPVQYEQKLYNKLSNAKWPVEKRKSTWAALCKDHRDE
ncbi:hypothetical protein AA313_de0206302 [Arthrobotrys entomopaga]|nr:hypothetical protein AA313_de0206302 [Arthrobotrys entomopaga]